MLESYLHLINNIMQKKFLTLVENHIVRNSNGGLLVGDVVKFVDDYKSKDSFKELPDTIKDAIAELVKTDRNIRVINIKTKYPSLAPGDELNRAGSFSVEITTELAPGFVDKQNKLTVCASLLKPENNYPNLPKIPNSFRRKEKINMKPVPVGTHEEAEENINSPHDQTGKTQQGDKLKPTEKSLPTKNTKLPNATAAKSATGKPIKESYTQMYVPAA